MISIYLRPDKTQVVEAELKKDKTLHVINAVEIDPFFQGFTEPLTRGYDQGEDAAIAAFSKLFLTLRRYVSIRSEEIYIVLPDFLFSVIDCYEFISDENLLTEVTNITGEPIDNFYITFPVTTEPPAPAKKTVYAIHKNIVDNLFKAASAQHIALASVEPASFSYFRALSDWALDHPIVEIFEDHASIVTYSPAGGIFKNDAPTITAEKLRADTLKADQIITAEYRKNEYACSQSFSNMRTDAEYTVFSSDANILKYNAVKLRLPQESPRFPDFVAHEFAPEDECEWMPVIGTLLQSFEEIYEDNDENPNYENLPVFIHVQNANLLPKEAREAAKSRQWKQIAKRLSKGVISVCAIAMLLEGGAAWYLNGAEISPKLQSEYDEINANKGTIEREMGVIRKAKTEDLAVVDAYAALTKARPQNCGFTTLTIGGRDPASKETRERFIKLSAIAQNEMTFQDFRNLLEGVQDFSMPTITSITSDPNGYKRAEFTIHKAGGSKE